MKKHTLLYHKETNTYWTNDENWKSLIGNDGVLYNYALIKSKNIFVVKQIMNNNGYRMLMYKDLEGTQFDSKINHDNKPIDRGD